MRRTDREIKDLSEIRKILESCTVCRVAMNDCGHPYVVPLSYGFSMESGEITLYFHCAKTGKKNDILQKDGTVCFEIDREISLIPGDYACDYGVAFESIIGWGTPLFIKNSDTKKAALSKIMERQTGKSDWAFDDRMVDMTAVFIITSAEFTAKRREIPKE